MFGNFVPAAFTSVRLPHDVQWYVDNDSFLPSDGSTLPAGSVNLATYTVIDDVAVPPQYERYVIMSWGDKLFPNPDEYVGYNADWNGFAPTFGADDGYLTHNHEYVSFPISLSAPEAPASLSNANPPVKTSALEVIGIDLNLPAGATAQQRQTVWGEFMYNQGMSIVRIRKTNGRFAPVTPADSNNRRISGMSGLGANSLRSDLRADGTPFKTITSWGTLSYQQGDQNWLLATGPGAQFVYRKSVDKLSSRVIGTAYNCSGGYTPWGTSLSCEENFQGSPGAFFIGVQEWVKPDGTQIGWNVGNAADLSSYTTGAFFGLVGEKYGLVVEVEPADRNVRARKHTALGRFRHENVTLRVEAGKKLVAYMGDDRRAGHTYKYVSAGTVTTPTDKNNSRLFYTGTLYVARFDAPADNANISSGTGRWIPLVPSTPVNPISPTAMNTPVPPAPAIYGDTSRKIEFPTRSFLQAAIAAAPSATYAAPLNVVGAPFRLTPANETSVFDGRTLLENIRTAGGTRPNGATLANYYDNAGAILMDCYLAANLVGATPTGRPEDLEVNPNNPSEVFIAYSDGLPGGADSAGEGMPDPRIFRVAKYEADVDAAQGSGGLYKIIEDSADGTGLTFTWERFLQGGEDGANSDATATNAAVACDGFANIDNMEFDDAGNLWLVTDMSTSRHNGFNTSYSGATLQPGQRTIEHAGSGSGDALVGVFGNNWMFCVPVAGPDAGKVIPFGYGPPRCEMTGPLFLGDTMILSVQHPSEDSPINGDPNAGGVPASTISRNIQMLALDGTLYTQTRTLPRGSNFPSILPEADGGNGTPIEQAPSPKPCVIGIRRKP